jgi:hypothetical protein
VSIHARITTPTAADDGKVPIYNATTDTWDLGNASGDVATATIWDAKGDLAAGTGNNAAARLAVGTNGQALVADSAQTTGLRWASITTDLLTATAWDAKGDLLAGTGADTAVRLPVGGNGLMLVADSAETTGLRWANTVRPTATTAVGLVVNGLASQTGVLQEWQANGTSLGTVSAAGTLTITPSVSTTTALIARSASTAYTTLARLRTAANVDAFKFDVSGTNGTDATLVLLADAGTGGVAQNRVRGDSAGYYFDRGPGTQEWLVYRAGGGASASPLYIRDMVNARMMATFSAGASANAATLDVSGRVFVGTASDYGASLGVLATATSRIGTVIRLASGQTANAVEVQANAGTVLAAFGVDGRLSLGSGGSFGGATGGVLAIADATAVPGSNPTGGGVLYSEGGALKWRGSSGTVTTIAPA